MTNWDKIQPAINKRFPEATAMDLACALEDSMSWLGGAADACDDCFCKDICAGSDLSCWQSIYTWLTSEVIEGCPFVDPEYLMSKIDEESLT